jgi:hypothetical protein
MEEQDRQWLGGKVKTSMLITVAQARSFFRRDEETKVVLDNSDGMWGLKVITEGQEYKIARKDFIEPKTWATRGKALAFIFENIGIPESTKIEVNFIRKEEKKHETDSGRCKKN